MFYNFMNVLCWVLTQNDYAMDMEKIAIINNLVQNFRYK